MANENKTALADAINKAGDQVKDDGTVKPATTETTTETQTDDKKEPPKTEEKKEPELTEEQKKAVELYEALNNPEKAGTVIDFLARRAGYTKTEVKEALKTDEGKDEVLDALKEELGTDFDFLTPKLAKALSKILDKKINERTADIRQTMDDKEQGEMKSAATKHMSSLADNYFDKPDLPEDIVNEMGKLMDRVKPDGSQSVESYIDDIFYAVIGRRNEKLTTKEQRSKSKNNRSDVVNNLTSGRASAASDDSGTPKRMTLSESISAAIEKANKEIN